MPTYVSLNAVSSRLHEWHSAQAQLPNDMSIFTFTCMLAASLYTSQDGSKLPRVYLPGCA